MSDCTLIINPVPENIRHQFTGVWEAHPSSTDLEPIATCHAEDGRLLIAGMARLSPSENIADAQDAELRMQEEDDEDWDDEDGDDEEASGDLTDFDVGLNEIGFDADLIDVIEKDVGKNTAPKPTSSPKSIANSVSKMSCILGLLNDNLGMDECSIMKNIGSIIKETDPDDQFSFLSAKGSVGSEAILVIFDPDNEVAYLCKTETLYPSETQYQGSCLCRMEIDYLPDDIHCHAVDYIRQAYVRQNFDPVGAMLFIASRPKTLNPDLDVDRYVKSKRLMLFGADGCFVAQGDKPVFARNTTMSGFSSQFHIRPEGDAQQNAEGRHTHDPFPALYKDLSIFYFVDGVDGFEWLVDAKEDIMTLHWHGHGLVYLSATFLSRDENRTLSWATIRECIKIIRGEENLSYYVSLCSAAPYLFYNILGLSQRIRG